VGSGKQEPYHRNNATLLFAVVRDPYTRAVSEWNYLAGIRQHDRNDKIWNMLRVGGGDNIPKGSLDLHSAVGMNDFLALHLRRIRHDPAAAYRTLDGHLIPRSDYFCKTTIIMDQQHQQQPPVAFLRSENLTAEFNCLMERYGLRRMSRLGTKKSMQSVGSLTVANLTLETQRLIEEVYDEDLRLFGYHRTTTTIRDTS